MNASVLCIVFLFFFLFSSETCQTSDFDVLTCFTLLKFVEYIIESWLLLRRDNDIVSWKTKIILGSESVWAYQETLK